jgi:hypothetical protein
MITGCCGRSAATCPPDTSSHTSPPTIPASCVSPGDGRRDDVVSAWLDPAASGNAPTRSNAERIDDAVEVLRACALGTYENRRITMGALLFGGLPDLCHERPSEHTAAIRYARSLTGIRSFRRLSDDLQTVALADASRSVRTV